MKREFSYEKCNKLSILPQYYSTEFKQNQSDIYLISRQSLDNIVTLHLILSVITDTNWWNFMIHWFIDVNKSFYDFIDIVCSQLITKISVSRTKLWCTYPGFCIMMSLIRMNFGLLIWNQFECDQNEVA